MRISDWSSDVCSSDLPDINTVNVQNRVSLAEPLLPDEVSRQGLTVQKQSSGLLQVVQLYSPNGTYDQLYLSNYATINVVDTLKRINGVGDADLFGARNYSIDRKSAAKDKCV